MAMTAERNDTLQTQAEKIYREKIRPQLTEDDKGKLIVINVETDQWAMDQDDVIASDKGIALWGRGQGDKVFGLRVGYRAVYSFQPGVDLELDEW